MGVEWEELKKTDRHTSSRTRGFEPGRPATVEGDSKNAVGVTHTTPDVLASFGPVRSRKVKVLPTILENLGHFDLASF
jgi:hypothetical protein